MDGTFLPQALTTIAKLATNHQSKLTIVVIDEASKEKEDVRFDTMTKSHAHSSVTSHLRSHCRELHSMGCTDFNVFTKDRSQQPSVTLGDVADEIKADLMVLSSDAVHEKSVDANLLAEFMPCPVLILP